MDLYIRFIYDKFVTNIFDKVDDFNFEVFSYPFTDSNVHSAIGYKQITIDKVLQALQKHNRFLVLCKTYRSAMFVNIIFCGNP